VWQRSCIRNAKAFANSPASTAFNRAGDSVERHWSLIDTAFFVKETPAIVIMHAFAYHEHILVRSAGNIYAAVFEMA
jgi:hypothetical protein